MKNRKMLMLLIPLLFGFSNRTFYDTDELHVNVTFEQVEEEKETYRQTYFSVEEGETKVGALISFNDKDVKVIDNVINYNDTDFGYLPIIAIDINEVKESGLNKKGTWNVYGSVVELDYGDYKQLAIILDACGACSRYKRIDLWVYKNDITFDVPTVHMTYVRYSWDNYLH